MAIFNEQSIQNSIKQKIKLYNIPVSAEEIKKTFSGIFDETKYNDGTTELVDVEIERLLVRKSCKYFIYKYGIMSMPGIGFMPFNMYYIQEKVIEEFEERQNIIFLKTRQVGISTITSLYSLWKMLDDTNLHTIDIISKTGDAAKEFKSRMDETLRRLPLFLFPKIKDKNSGELRYLQSIRELPNDNKTQLMFSNGSKFKCETASENAGRGDALSLLILDEAAFFKTYKLVEEIWKSAAPTLTKTKGKAIIISTPSGTFGKGEWYYKKWMESKSGEGPFFPITIDWWEIPDPDKDNEWWLDELVKKDYYHKPELRQEGLERARYEEENIDGNKWLKKQRDDLGIITFKQEILHDFITTGENVFSSEKLKQVELKLTPPILKDNLNGQYIKGLWIWKYPEPKRKYVIGVDSSRGSGRDSSCIEILDSNSLEQVAEFKGFLSTKKLGEITRKIGKYYNNAYLIIECNNLGEATFNEVYYHDTDPYENVFKKIVKKPNGGTVTIGWDTTPAVRILMTDDFINFIENDELFKLIKIYSERLYTEMCSWIFDGTKPIHEQGFHDDAILGFCLALYNRSKFIRKDDFILTTNESIDYSDINADDLEMYKMQKKFEEDMDIHQLKEERRADKLVRMYGVDYYDYSWILGFDPEKDK